MTLKLARMRRIRFVFHSLGLSCMGGAIFLQVLVFTDILRQGYFIAKEQNQPILILEVALTIFAALYFVYIYLRLLKSEK